MRAPLLMALFAAGLAAQVPDLAFDSAPNFIRMPEHIHMGEVAGVATDSKGNVYVYTRTGSDNATMGGSRIFTHGGSRLFEFDATGRFLREIGVGVYGFLVAQAVRVDAQDNIWVVDRGGSQVMKFDQTGRIAMVMGRKPEAINPGGGRGPAQAPAAGRGGEGRGAAPAAAAPPAGGRGPVGGGVRGDNFQRPTDVAFDAAGNIFVADGYGNSRVAKFAKNGLFLKSWGSRGTEDGQFNTPHSIAVDPQGNVYVADMGNKRIQVFDNDGVFKSTITGVGSPRAMCISQGAHPLLYVSNSNAVDSDENGEIYRMELDGKILGKFGQAGKQLKEFWTANALDCRSNSLYVGEIGNWRVQKLAVH